MRRLTGGIPHYVHYAMLLLMMVINHPIVGVTIMALPLGFIPPDNRLAFGSDDYMRQCQSGFHFYPVRLLTLAFIARL